MVKHCGSLKSIMWLMIFKQTEKHAAQTVIPVLSVENNVANGKFKRYELPGIAHVQKLCKQEMKHDILRSMLLSKKN
jgi:hypothetical protein